jgi:Holliday junction resolvasome RuvABC endonuclease subunit
MMRITSKPCRSSACGIAALVNEAFTRDVIPQISPLHFLGVDVSSQVLGLTVVRYHREELDVVHSSTTKLPVRKPRESRSDILLRRVDALHASLAKLPIKPHRVLIEDRLITTFGASGVIGKQTLVELNTAAILASSMLLQIQPTLVNPKTARSGLGINNRGGAGQTQTRAQVKEKASALASQLVSSIRFTEDEADAFIVATYGIRLEMAKLLGESLAVRGKFGACHNDLLSQPDVFNNKLDLKTKEWCDEYFFARVMMPAAAQ